MYGNVTTRRIANNKNELVAYRLKGEKHFVDAMCKNYQALGFTITRKSDTEATVTKQRERESNEPS